MDDTLWYIIIAVWLVGAGIWKLLSKVAVSGATGRTLVEVGKRSKGLLETLVGEEQLQELKRAMQPESEPEQPESTRLAEPEVSPPVEEPIAERLRRFGERARAKPRRLAEEPPPEPPRPTRAPPAPAAEARPVRRATGPAAGLLAQSRSGNVQALREAILLREIFGPPIALEPRSRPGAPWMLAGAFGPPVPPVKAASPAPGGTGFQPVDDVETADVPHRVVEMYKRGMITREQFEALREFHTSRARREK
ncbi:hypothetical protein AMJ85_04035 [candidate division BRC1 bacterium SM23_51]|nr:MAG: hypothetical protein AMJ85_04035 [candidate division BRC1 bacterium SM23_51]